jgi:hypothetical protein
VQDTIRHAAPLLALALAACASLAPPDRDYLADLARGDAREVKVRIPPWLPDPLPVAADHCGRHGRVPQLREITTTWAVFDCVPPAGASLP